MRTTVASALLAVAAAAMAEEPKPMPIYGLAEGALKDGVVAFIGSNGASWGGSADYPDVLLWADGKGTYRYSPIGDDAMSSVGCSCAGRGRYAASGRSLRVTCTQKCVRSYSQMGGPVPSTVEREGVETLSLDLVVATDSTLLAREVAQPGEEYPPCWFLVDRCRVADKAGALPYCEARSLCAAGARFGDAKPRDGEDDDFFLELIPGAKDQALLSAAKAALQRSDDGRLRKHAVLLEGLPARNPRATSEVFYANGRKSAAAFVAALLEPQLGKVAVKPWPGKWEYDVVVVVGAAVATATPR